MQLELDPPGNIIYGFPEVQTGVEVKNLLEINEELVKWPEGFTPNKKLGKILERRLDSFGENGKLIGHMLKH